MVGCQKTRRNGLENICYMMNVVCLTKSQFIQLPELYVGPIGLNI